MSKEIAYYMEVNSFFGPIQKYLPHATPNYGSVKSNFEVDYYIQIYFSPENVAHIRKTLEPSV